MASSIGSLSAIEEVCAGGVDQGCKLAITQVGRRRSFGTAPRAEPLVEVQPPAALSGLGRVEPCLRVRGASAIGPIARLRVAGRVDQRRDVAAGGKDEPVLAAEQPGGAVAA